MDSKKLEKLAAMAKTNLATERKLFRGFLYGDFGVGKTHMAGQIAKVIGGPICLITTDSAWTTLLKDPEIADLTTRYQFDSLAAVRMMVEAHIEGIEPYASYKTLIWDTVTTSIDNVLRDLVELKKFPTEQRDPTLEAYPHYRMASNSLKKTVDLIKESDLHVIYTGHVKFPSEADQRKKKFAIRPTGPEASYYVVGQEVNLIGWLFKERAGREYQRKIQTSGTVEETAKSQIPTIPETILNQDEIPGLVQKWLMQ